MSDRNELETKVAVIIQIPAGSDAYEQAEEIIALVEQDVARRLLSDEAKSKMASQLWGAGPSVGPMVDKVHKFIAGAIGIDVEKLS